MKGTKWEEGFCKARMVADYITFTAMQGNKYAESKDIKGNPFKFMLVGRAVNGWDEFRRDADKPLSEEIFVESSIDNIANNQNTIIFGKDRFEWINTDGDIPHNQSRPGIDRKVVKGDYFLNRAQIWSYTKGIWDNLYGRETEWNERWFENIVWNNLYKIAPHDEGNPGECLQRQERSACIELLKAEIDYLKPTHIFFATARDGWYDKFDILFNNKKNIGTNVYLGKYNNEEYVEAVAEYQYKDGNIAKVVVACRPEGRTKNKYVKQVSEMFTQR